MDARLLLTAACASGFAGAAFAGGMAHRAVWHVVSAARMQSPAMGEGIRKRDVKAVMLGVIAYMLRNGVKSFEASAGALRTIPAFDAMASNGAHFARRRGIAATETGVASSICFALCVLACLCAVLSRSALAGILVPAAAALGTSMFLSHERERELELLREQVPDALRCMEACLHAGLSLPQAFAEVAEEAPSPSKELFSQVSHDLELGYSMDQALRRFHKLSALPELGFVAMALDIQYACGGSAAPILQSAETSLMHGLELRRSLRVQTAQARLSAQVVSIMPFALLAVLSMVSPGFLNPFFTSSQGVAVLAMALAMQAIGIVMVRKLLDVEL